MQCKKRCVILFRLLMHVNRGLLHIKNKGVFCFTDADEGYSLAKLKSFLTSSQKCLIFLYLMQNRNYVEYDYL